LRLAGGTQGSRADEIYSAQHKAKSRPKQEHKFNLNECIIKRHSPIQ